MKKLILAIFALLIFAVASVALSQPKVDNVSTKTSVNGKYSNLVQVLKCEKDKGNYGEFKDYGHWSGGPWCGKTGKSGYWVWVYPNWYVWAKKGASPKIPAKATVNGKYSNLTQILKCEKDKKSYGEFKDYGYWSGGPWCGKTGKSGHWVWVYPNWYVWGNKK